MRQRSSISVALLLVVLTTACSHASSPTSPTTAAAASPQISDVAPGTPVQNYAPQLITVRGRNFGSGLLMFMTFPDQSQLTLTGPDIQAAQSTSFEAVVPLQLSGSYRVTVKNADGETSAPYAFAVAIDPARTAPVISELTPASVMHGAQAQSFSIGGVNFTSDLTLAVTAPDSSVSTVGGSAMHVMSGTSLQASVVIATAGAYAFAVVDGTGRTSNAVTILVK